MRKQRFATLREAAEMLDEFRQRLRAIAIANDRARGELMERKRKLIHLPLSPATARTSVGAGG